MWKGGQWSQHFSSSSLQVNIETCLFRHFGPQKEKFSQGVTALQLLPSGKFLLGTGEGVVAEVTGAPHFKKLRTARMPGAVTSVALRGSGNQVWASHTHTHTHTHTTHTHTPHTHTHSHTHSLTHSHCHTLSVLQFFIGMATAQMYQFEYESFSSSLIGSCHNSAVTDIVFPRSVADPPPPRRL